MAINRSDVLLLHRLTEQPDATLASVARRMNRTPTALRRRVREINRHLAPEDAIAIDQGRFSHAPTYEAFTRFLEQLDPEAYAPDAEERIALLAVEAVLHEPLSAAALYRTLGVSPATKKDDIKRFRERLRAIGLELAVAHRQGIRLVGEEFRKRLVAVQALLPLVEIDGDGRLTARRANTPFERRIVAAFMAGYRGAETTWRACVKEVIGRYARKLSYRSKKFLALYIVIATLRMARHRITTAFDPPLPVDTVTLFQEPLEDRALNLAIAMLDVSPSLAFPANPALAALVERFVDSVQAQIVTTFVHRDRVEQELFAFFSKHILRKRYGVVFRDTMVRDAQEHLPLLYRLAEEQSRPIERAFQVAFGNDQYTTLALILRKHVDLSRVFGRNRKRVAVVTNTAAERIDFFLERLTALVECEPAIVCSLNEVDILDAADVDEVIVFSDRIALVLERLGRHPIKLDFFLGRDDLEQLLAHGFSTSRRRYLASAFAHELAGKPERELCDILQTKYRATFI